MPATEINYRLRFVILIGVGLWLCFAFAAYISPPRLIEGIPGEHVAFGFLGFAAGMAVGYAVRGGFAMLVCGALGLSCPLIALAMNVPVRE